MSQAVHIIWGSLAAGLYRSNVLDMSVRLAHAQYVFRSSDEALAFLRGIGVSRKPDDWAHVQSQKHQEVLGVPLCDRLITAAKNGDVRMVVHLLRAGVSADYFDDNGWGALHYACAEGHDGVVAALAESKASLNLPTGCLLGRTGLHLCAGSASHGHLEALRILLSSGARATDVDVDGNSALHFAAAGCNTGALALLLAEGAYIDGTNRFGFVPKDVAGRGSAIGGDFLSDAQHPGPSDMQVTETRDLLEKAEISEMDGEKARAAAARHRHFFKPGFAKETRDG